jgi:hypothetical protein
MNLPRCPNSLLGRGNTDFKLLANTMNNIRNTPLLLEVQASNRDRAKVRLEVTRDIMKMFRPVWTHQADLRLFE